LLSKRAWEPRDEIAWESTPTGAAPASKQRPEANH
jgi:hypothetical protein